MLNWSNSNLCFLNIYALEKYVQQLQNIQHFFACILENVACLFHSKWVVLELKSHSYCPWPIKVQCQTWRATWRMNIWCSSTACTSHRCCRWMSHFDGMSGKTNVKYLGSRIVPQLPNRMPLPEGSEEGYKKWHWMQIEYVECNIWSDSGCEQLLEGNVIPVEHKHHMT
jgi:hypothetical protein